MEVDNTQSDSPLSVSANITGILTFLVAIAAAIYARFTYLRNSGEEYFRVKASLSWYKTESQWLANLLAVVDAQREAAYEQHGDDADGDIQRKGEHMLLGRRFRSHQAEYQMYAFVMEDLLNLEKRLLELVAEVEEKSSDAETLGHHEHVAGGVRWNQGWSISGDKPTVHRRGTFISNGSVTSPVERKWALVPKGWWSDGRPSVAMAWLAVRTKALDLVRQREALTTRVQFLQMSMVAASVKDLESRMKWREKRVDENTRRVEELVEKQAVEMRRLEGLLRQSSASGSVMSGSSSGSMRELGPESR